MRLIFYDFETTDLHTLGQIVNFSFVVTDEQFKVIDELSDSIRIERTVLPRAQAILANRVEVLSHNDTAELSEAAAVAQIAAFLEQHIQEAGEYQAVLVGYNSLRFDLKYLRTTFIRNGFNPYGKYRNADLFFLAQKLFFASAEFRKTVTKYCEQHSDKVRLSLEVIASAHGMLSGEQKHESRADVLLTIELAKCFRECGVDLLEFDPYEIPYRLSNGAIQWRYQPWPNPDSRVLPYMLVSKTNRSSLWADLEHAQTILEEGGELKQCVRYVKRDDAFFQGEEGDLAPYKKSVQKVEKSLVGMSMEEYFEDTTCDIEEYIYRIRPGDIDGLRAVFEKEKRKGKLTDDQQELFLRYRLRNYEWGSGHDEAVKQKFTEFAKSRYSGDCELLSGEKYPSYAALVEEIEIDLSATSDTKDKALLSQLLEFYNNSDIARALSGSL